ncbi:MAG TPA: class I SAM-dependent methyltransferase [Acidimicrobiales bacterium]|nr:class I SAM-dependent methyltransferase [Acidimicrobiales bacterium]
MFRRSPPEAEVLPRDRLNVDEDMVDVEELLARYTIEELVQSAEHYFSRLPSWDVALAKPVSSPDEAPELLTTFGALFRGLELAPGDTVLDFGAGSGWTSWMISQVGCQVIVSDVSETALKIAAERYERWPLLGPAPAPTFLPFDGRRLALDDGSVDRIACNDCFHHVPNPSEVLSEFERVLSAGGICVMSEPGANHSRQPQSQAEMRNFRVVERDIVLDDIVDQARAAGFEAVEVALYCGQPHFVDARSYAASLGPDSPAPRQLMESYLTNRTLLRLRKSGGTVLDSRRRPGLQGSIRVEVTGAILTATVSNTGGAVWLQSPGAVGLVNLGVHLFNTDGGLVDFDFMRIPLCPDGTPIPPGGEVVAQAALHPLEPGSYRLVVDLVSEGVCWFADNGRSAVSIDIDV